ncbi:MAG: transcriptional regulator [Ramlibacter sp.]|jgi:DNA-binding MarR family transcriptional regulator|nr:transcriptional regulator [Ramlibacter sp.]
MESSPRTFYRILRLKHAVAVVMEEALAPAGLTANQYTVLSMVRRMAPVTSAELARKLQISAQSMGESLKALEARALVSRSTSPANKRMVLFVLSPEGKKITLKADKLVAKAEERFLSCLAPEALRSFEESLGTLRARHAQEYADQRLADD